ncbi:MAG TPA: OmpH family outer membrane protein [Vicinamibacterales bacterium]|jgi:outer membrane protein
MRVWCLAAGLSCALLAAPTFAQTPPPKKPAPTVPAAKPATPPEVTAPRPEPPPVFPAGAKVAYIDIQRIAAESSAGRVASGQVQALIKKKQDEGAARAKMLQDNQAKLQQGGSVMSDDARAKLQQQVEQEQVDAQRFQQDAQREINDLQQRLQAEFEKKLMPVIDKIVTEKGIQVLLSRSDAGIVWASPSLDLTDEIIKRFDDTAKPPTGQPRLR